MARRRMSFKQWHAMLGQPVPLDLVPQLLGVAPDQVRAAVRARRLRVVSFHADNGQVYRMVPRADLARVAAVGLNGSRIGAALRRLMAA